MKPITIGIIATVLIAAVITVGVFYYFYEQTDEIEQETEPEWMSLPQTPSSGVTGDINNDGTIDMLDTLLLANWIEDHNYGEIYAYPDINCDDTLNNYDTTYLQNYRNGDPDYSELYPGC